ncbi:hypothetical protein HAX54_005224 [Datura stramonium]|uniref:Uncharacterized protein n=1 Tax=Datura stramonium TaxID=4076 RepID=A0ABS8WVS1_DATST|nr:hypothetical protein [Datura stramonium]
MIFFSLVLCNVVRLIMELDEGNAAACTATPKTEETTFIVGAPLSSTGASAGVALSAVGATEGVVEEEESLSGDGGDAVSSSGDSALEVGEEVGADSDSGDDDGDDDDGDGDGDGDVGLLALGGRGGDDLGTLRLVHCCLGRKEKEELCANCRMDNEELKGE